MSSGNAFVFSSVFAMAQLVLTAVSIWAAFTRPRFFWALCVVFFLSYPFDIFLLAPWFPNVIYVEDPTNYRSAGLNLGVPILLLLLSVVTYFFAYRHERSV